jgi:hypothetical protein
VRVCACVCVRGLIDDRVERVRSMHALNSAWASMRMRVSCACVRVHACVCMRADRVPTYVRPVAYALASRDAVMCEVRVPWRVRYARCRCMRVRAWSDLAVRVRVSMARAVCAMCVMRLCAVRVRVRELCQCVCV